MSQRCARWAVETGAIYSAKSFSPGRELTVGITAINQQIRTPETITYNLTAAFVDQAFEQLTQSNLAQRLVIPGMEAQRADLIPASISLLQYVIKQLNIQHIIQSEYAIKEGVIWAVLYQPNLLQPNSSIFVNA